MTKEQGDMALLLAHNQVSCHVKDLASGVDIVVSFNKECKQGEKVRRGYILYCCVNIKNGKWFEPRSCVLEWNLVIRVK